MKGIEKLLKGATSAGNHTAEHTNNRHIFKYHGNTVCIANDNTRQFEIHNCGYAGYSSTTRTLNEYKYHFNTKGYSLVYEGK